MSRLTEILNGLILSEGLNATRLNFDDEALEPLIQALYHALLEDVIGDDEPLHNYLESLDDVTFGKVIAKNFLKAELRQKLSEFCGMEVKDE